MSPPTTATGGWRRTEPTLSANEVVSASPSLSVTVRRTVYMPWEKYWCVGLVAVEVEPSPNSQNHVTTVPPRSVDCHPSNGMSLKGSMGKLDPRATAALACGG